MEIYAAKRLYWYCLLSNLRISVVFLLFQGCLFSSCNNRPTSAQDGNEKKETVKTVTPVTLTKISRQPMVEFTELSATATFLQKSFVKSNINGYLQVVNAKLGGYVTEGQPLFSLVTKEARSIDSKINNLNPDFKFSGVSSIKANGNGYITQLNHLAGDYVQDGEQLAVISDKSSFAFLLNLPYELRKYVVMGEKTELTLPDGNKINGTVTSAMPTVDPATQTQIIVIKIPASQNIPENLVAKVRIVKSQKANAISLPKGAVLTNDVQSEFWVMQLIDSNKAVKIFIKKGIEINDRIEILSPVFNDSDKIILSGNFGLPDTAMVSVFE